MVAGKVKMAVGFQKSPKPPSHVKLELPEHEVVPETAFLVPVPEGLICSKNAEIAKSVKRIEELEASDERMSREME
ncbi:hypothetical protein ACJRO7_024193, partial [Eucalyptus globulus]